MYIIYNIIYLGVKSYNVSLVRDGDEDLLEDTWNLKDITVSEIVVKSFSWAQWDPVHQVCCIICIFIIISITFK